MDQEIQQFEVFEDFCHSIELQYFTNTSVATNTDGFTGKSQQSMSGKLNSEKLAKMLFPKNISPMTPLGEAVFAEQRRAAAFAISEVAQPIADQRDELLVAFESLVARLELDGKELPGARALIAKCTTKQ